MINMPTHYNQNNQSEQTEDSLTESLNVEGAEQVITITISTNPKSGNLNFDFDFAIPLLNNAEEYDRLPDNEKDLQVGSQMIASGVARAIKQLQEPRELPKEEGRIVTLG